jgi:hypothetical protein
MDANPGFEFIRGDIRDREIVRAASQIATQWFTWQQLWGTQLALASPT